MITLFTMFSLVILLGISAYAVFRYINDESQMEKVPVRVKNHHHN
ncbi:hypothetical protein [Enterococcus saigonensis]